MIMTNIALPDLEFSEVRKNEKLLSLVVAGQKVCQETTGGGEKHGVGGLWVHTLWTEISEI